jgi:hypothetical protein
MLGGGRSFIQSTLVGGAEDDEFASRLVEPEPEPGFGAVRRNESLEMRITGSLELVLDCSKSDVVYSSSSSGR